MFGRERPKKMAKVVEPEETEEETEEEVEEETEEESKAPEITPKAKSVFRQKIKATARIVTGEIMENGLYRFILVSNKSIGEIGEELPLE